MVAVAGGIFLFMAAIFGASLVLAVLGLPLLLLRKKKRPADYTSD